MLWQPVCHPEAIKTGDKSNAAEGSTREMECIAGPANTAEPLGPSSSHLQASVLGVTRGSALLSHTQLAAENVPSTSTLEHAHTEPRKLGTGGRVGIGERIGPSTAASGLRQVGSP